MIRQLTPGELDDTIYDSLRTFWNFGCGPGAPGWDDEPIVWSDILAIPPVTDDYLFDHTMVVAHQVTKGVAIMNRPEYTDHVANTAREAVKDYRDYLTDMIAVRV